MKVLCKDRNEITSRYSNLVEIGLIQEDNDEFYVESHVVSYYRYLNSINNITNKDKEIYLKFRQRKK